MVRKSGKQTTVDDDFEEHILDTNVGDEMQASFLEYAYSVIYSRALPDARDGLKPVQRRILYTMDDMGLRSNRGHVKSARPVGEVMGRLHPHGDSAIYDALVRMVQDWSLRLPLLDGHGNFGSPDDPPAAMRYTECRLATAAEAMTAEIDEDTVDFKANYDGREQEPTVLPAAIPQLLVNGATGIAVGMATNIAPHNLVEVVQGLRHLITHPNATLDDIMRFIPGPDLPTGGRIVGLDGVREAYESGNGSFKIQAATRIENVTPRRKGIVITELPFNVGPEKVIEAVKKLVQAKKIEGISDLKNLTDRKNGLRLVIEIKNGFVPEAVLQKLFKLTPLESSFSINAVALVDGQPRTLSLLDMLRVFLEHRIDVVRRRSEFRRNKAQSRLHLVLGLLIAIVDIDEVIQLIRASDDRAAARERLRTVFDLSDAQADYILDLQLGRLTKFSRIELEQEADTLRSTIEDLTTLLEDENALRGVVGDELGKAAAAFGNPRRTVLLESSGATTTAAPLSLEVADDPCWVLLSSTGLIARTSDQSTLGHSDSRGLHDTITSITSATARGQVGVIDSEGFVHRIDVIDLPALPATADGPKLGGGVSLGDLVSDLAQPLALMSFQDENNTIALATRSGIVKRVKYESVNKDSWHLIRLADGDAVVGAAENAGDDTEFVFITTDAQLLRFSADLVRPQGRDGQGIAGIKLAAQAELLAFGVCHKPDTAHIATVAGSSQALNVGLGGTVKVTPLDVYPRKGRATGGVRCHRFLAGEDALTLAWAGDGIPMAATDAGGPIELPALSDRRDGSGVTTDTIIHSISARPTTTIDQ